MPDPTLLGDRIQPAWQDLTPEQRTCWHFWALAHPQLDATGNLQTFYGQQAHYSRNSALAVVDADLVLTDPPTSDAAPAPLNVTAEIWPLQSRTASATTARYGLAIVRVLNSLPTNVRAILTQGYDTKRRPRGRPPRVRHVATITDTSGQTIDPTVPDGYFASTSGNNRFARIYGRTARRRPELPFAKLRIIDIETGKQVRQAIANPFGGARTKSNRARATAIKPRAGDHYP